MYLKSTKNEFYVYIYLNPLKPGYYTYGDNIFDFEPFYVGKGNGRRFLDHLVNQEGSQEKNHLINSLLDSNNYPIIIKIKEKLSEDEAFHLEKKLIKIIGRKILNEGPLLNIQPGGEGFSGWVITENWKEKNKITQIKRWKNADAQYRKKHADNIRKSLNNPITKQKFRDNAKKYWNEERDRMLSYQKLPSVKEKKSITSIQKLSKSYIMISPLNERFKTNRLKEFCKQYNLCYDAVLSVAKGKSISNKGWICFLDKDGEEERILKKIEELKKEKRERKIIQNLNQVGKHIHNDISKQKIGKAAKGNKYGLGYKHTEEDKKIIQQCSLNMWKKRRGEK